MRRAIELAGEAEAAGDVPIGAVLVCGERVFEARNEKERRPDPTAHAEILAIRAAAEALGVWRLPNATLYVTKEPCAMCAGAIVASRIERLVSAAAVEQVVQTIMDHEHINAAELARITIN